MSIKRLLPNIKDPISLELGQGRGVLLVKYENHVTEFYLLQGIEGQEDVFFNLENVLEWKYVGDRDQVLKLGDQDLSWLEKPHRVIPLSDLQMVFYYPESHSLRVPKSLPYEENLFKASEESPKKVLIVDDSKSIQGLLKKVIEKSHRLTVMGLASSPSEAKKIIEQEKPDIITLDIHMPEMTGVDFLKSYLKFQQIPVVLVSSVSMSEGPIVMEGLSQGAQSYIQKPSLDSLSEFAPNIIKELETLAYKKIFWKADQGKKKTAAKFKDTKGLIAIGSSTGGPQALEAILAGLPSESPPIVIVQHIPAVFSKALAERLNDLCEIHIKEAKDQEILQPNTAYIAPGGQQLKVKKRGRVLVFEINDDPPLNRFKPSVDYMMNSVVRCKLENTVGIILTGMGSDGADGLLQLKNHGAKTIAQDQKTSVVYGMPREAFERGAVDSVCPIEQIAERMILDFNSLLKKKAA